MPHSKIASRVLWFAPAALFLAACNSDSGLAHSVSLSFTTRSAAPVSGPAASSIRADIVVGSGPNSISISAAQMGLSEIELKPSGTTCSTTGEDDGCEELEVGPKQVDLPVDGTTQVVLDALVPPGTYDGLDADLDTVIVKGVFTDANSATHDFTDTLIVDAGIEAAFEPPVTVGASTTNLTIHVDMASWFTDANGAVIDPTNKDNFDAIKQNIERSFEAFEDDNHDGEDDSQEHGGTGGDN